VRATICATSTVDRSLSVTAVSLRTRPGHRTANRSTT
jgi:hypothetical protein